MPPAAVFGRPLEPRIASLYDGWLDAVRDIANAGERAAFTGLRSDLERERFIRGFWRARGEGAAHRFAENRRAAVQLRLRSTDEERVVILAGKPATVTALSDCGDRLHDLEIWTYSAWEVAHQSGVEASEAVSLLFVQGSRFDPRTARLWSFREGMQPLVEGWQVGDPARVGELVAFVADQGCLAGRGAREELQRALGGSLDFETLAARFGWSFPDPARRSSLDEAEGAPTDGEQARVVETLEPGRELVGRLDTDVRLGLRYLGSYAEGTLLQGTLRLPTDRIHRSSPSLLLDRLSIGGDVYRGTRLLDSFETTFLLIGAEPGEATVNLDFYRRLRPGPYRIQLRVADDDDLALLREDFDLTVPALDKQAARPTGEPQEIAELTREQVVRLHAFPRIEILPPGKLIGPRTRVETVITGGPIAAVRFELDGQTVNLDREPPFVADLELPRSRHHLEAVALDAADQPVARDDIDLERVASAFALELDLVRDGDGVRRAPVQVVVPERETLDRIDCYWNQELRTSLRAPPYECPVPESWSGALAFVRAVAVLANGDATEDVAFLAGAPPEQVDVQLVELYLSALDGRGRPLLDLDPSEVTVIESGAAQQIVSLRTVENLPLHVAVLMDTSSSLGRRVRAAARSAEEFFANVLRPDDRASLLVFSHDVRQLVPFTGDVDALRYAASGLRAYGSTRLYDALAYAFFTFGGQGSRRALVALTDGSDTGSDLTFEQALDGAIRARVAVYPIALGAIEEKTRGELARLASDTGGRLFEVADVDDLDGVYRQIEAELRSQLLLVYRPQHVAGLRELREVEVRIARPGAVTRNVRGYYP